jgi:16S rRNA C967 or C1407 C5-methylase (RsmB/RsmF family)
MLAPGGALVYSTCSINPAENDGVVERLYEKYGSSAVAEKPPQFILDEAAGPMYIAVVRKRNPVDLVGEDIVR